MSMLENKHYEFLLEEVHKGGNEVIKGYNIACKDVTLDIIKEWVKNDPEDVRCVCSMIVCTEENLCDNNNPAYNHERDIMASKIIELV